MKSLKFRVRYTWPNDSPKHYVEVDFLDWTLNFLEMTEQIGAICKGMPQNPSRETF